MLEKVLTFSKNTGTQCSNCGSSSVGRALAFQAKGRGFESRLPLKIFEFDSRIGQKCKVQEEN